MGKRALGFQPAALSLSPPPRRSRHPPGWDNKYPQCIFLMVTNYCVCNHLSISKAAVVAFCVSFISLLTLPNYFSSTQSSFFLAHFFFLNEHSLWCFLRIYVAIYSGCKIKKLERANNKPKRKRLRSSNTVTERYYEPRIEICFSNFCR